MTRLSRATRHLGAVAAATLALATLPAGAAAFADTGVVTQSSPAFVANTGASTRIVFTLSSAPTSPGELLDVRLTGPAGNTVSETGTPQVDGETVAATFDLRGAAPGVYAVRVADASGAVDEYDCASCLRVLATPPTVSGVSPATRGASSPAAAFTVTGTNLFQGVSVRFLRAGANDPAIAYPSNGSLTVSADNRTVTGQLAVAATAVPGPRDVEVTNTDGQRVVCDACLTVTPAPSFVSLSPHIAGQGAIGRSMTLVGADFQPSMAAAFYTPGSTTDKGGVVVTSFAVDDDAVARVTVNVADRGDTVNVQRDLVLTNPDGGTTRIANALTLTPEPVVTALSPNTLDGGATDELLVVTGTGLSANPTFQFSGTGVTVNGYTPDDATAATRGILDVSVAPGATTGGRTVTVVNPDGGRSTSGNVLTVGATPTVTKVTPPSLGRGAANRTLTISGSGFDNSGGVAVTIPGVTVSGATATSPTSITATVSVPGTADLGTRDVSVLNTAAGRRGRATCAGCFAIDTFSVDSVTPSAVLNSATYRLDVYGSELPAGETLTATLTRSVARAGQDPIVFDGEVNADGTRFTGTVDLRDMAPGGYTLRLAKGDAVGTCTCTFSIVAERAPSVTSVAPSSVPQGAQGRELTVKGAGFSHGTDVRFGTGVTKAGDVTFVDSNTLRVPVDVDAAATGSVPVTVLVPGFSSDSEATCANCLSVSKRPTVTSSSRTARGQGAPAIGITLTGTEFQPGVSVSVGGGVLVTDVVRVSATSLTFTAEVADDAVPGPRTITVTNPDGGAGTCGCFSVTPRPLTTSVTPANGSQGRSGVDVTLSGSGYQAGAAVSFGPDIVVSNVAASGDRLTATLDLTNAQTGAHPITVTNGDGGQASCECSFTVYVAPTISGLTPSSRGADSAGETVTIMGTNFTDAATVAFADPGITVTSTRVVDSFRIDVVVDIARDVEPGTRSVTVTNVDTDQSASCSACFTVNAAPTLTATEASAERGARGVVVTYQGTGFQPGAVRADLGDGITVTDAQALTASSVRVTFDVADDAALGDRDLKVVNGDGGRATCGSCLTVTDPPPPPPAPEATSIDDFRASPTRVVAGSPITMYGTLRDSDGDGIAGQNVRIYVTGGGFSSWVLWKTVTTAADGTFTKSATMTRTRTIKAVFLPASDEYARADSASQTVGVATRVRVTSPTSGSRVTAGRTFTVRGTTYPAKPGTTAYLFWRKSDGSVTLLRRGTIASDGTFALSKSLRRGNYRVQVGIPATSGNLAGRSAYITLYVR